MRKVFTYTFLLCLASLASAQLCCNVVDKNGTPLVTTNGVCLNAPNAGCSTPAVAAVTIVDSDGDGIADEDDDCPHEAGNLANDGCPDLTEEEKGVLAAALAGVQFASNSDELIGDSESKLDDIVTLMQAHEDFSLMISGYTDNTGNADYNLELSDKRAQSAKNYLVSKGIAADRIEAKGYGIENPVATNDTPEGRAQNRRVEFELVH